MSNLKGLKRKKKKSKLYLPSSRVEKLYSNLHNQTAISSLQQFTKAFKEPLDLVALEESLRTIPAYSRHLRVRKRYRRPSLIVREPRQYYCADLADLSSLKFHNSHYCFILVVQDCFSKLVSAVLLKQKTGKEVAAAFRVAFKQLKGACLNLITDAGKEFVAAETQRVFKEFKVNHILSKTNAKSFQCEVMIKIIKEKIFRNMSLTNSKRYVDALPLIVEQYNNKPHSATGLPPTQVTKKNSNDVFSFMYRKIISKPRPEPKFKPLDLVRISSKRLIFTKAYKPGWSAEIFKVHSIIPSWPVFSFRLVDLKDNLLESSFVSEELNLVKRYNADTGNV